jgi:sulfur-oxidizing protein SoxA
MRGRRLTSLALACAALAASSVPAMAQTDAEKAIDRYREMVADGNPAELWEAKGEDLWKRKRGPRNASLEKCDLGQGPGVVKGAYVGLPRYFDDVKRVQDLETRLVTCMEQHQGIVAKAAVYDRDDHRDVISLVAWIASESRGMPVNVPQNHPEERRMYEMGKRIFFYRAGPYDFACATCHAEDGKRIRLQGLPNLTKNEPAGRAFTSWPAYRVSNSQLWPMQKRLEDCFRQQRFPYVEFGSDVTIALSSYMGVTGKGVKSLAPTIKR